MSLKSHQYGITIIENGIWQWAYRKDYNNIIVRNALTGMGTEPQAIYPNHLVHLVGGVWKCIYTEICVQYSTCSATTHTSTLK